jgi:hypothetical protein
VGHLASDAAGLPEDILRTLTFLLPGFLAYIVYRTVIPRRPESDFSLTAKSLVWSLAIDGVINGVGQAFGNCRLDFSQPGIIGIALVLAAGSGYGLAKFRQTPLADRIYAGAGIRTTWHPDVWTEFLDSGKRVREVFVEMKDGRVFAGEVSGYTDDPEATIREILLKNVYVYPHGWDSEPSWVEGDVYIALGSIRSMVGQPSSPATDTAANDTNGESETAQSQTVAR